MPSPTPTRCPLCGQPNVCGQTEGSEAAERCWCFDVTIAPQALAQIPPAQRGKACLCRRCATGERERPR
ncbi:cysteine-rich CWC family protein [Stutzerimonas azotifigens]|uniref:cysteine-rich CWC family protein n=1 Tax=Stutzerimonas azotifigens TaxID=291995 RepID=UPI0004040A4F|nr:cysteine-rich CWC family protein [Stutzerimonas azotifigens]